MARQRMLPLRLPVNPPRYDDAVRQRNLGGGATVPTLLHLPPPPPSTVSADAPPDYWDSMQSTTATAPTTTAPASAFREDDEFNDVACLCAIFCLGLKLLSILGR